MSEYTADNVIGRWDARASDYAAKCSKHGDTNKAVLLTPVLLTMLGDVDGKKVLDAGCGEGFLSRLMAERGARVVAVDYSSEMLKIARERTPESAHIDYQYANLERLDALSAGTFDITVSCAVLHDVPDYESALKEICRVTSPRGFVLVAIMHPCFSSDGGWVRDEDGKKLHWKIDNYFREGAFEVPLFPNADRNPINFNRTLTSYYRAIRSAGLKVDDIVEPMPSPSAIEKHPEYVHDLRMSHYLVLKLIR